MAADTMAMPDPRTHAYRPDIAARDLEGKVAAAKFAEGRDMQVRAAMAPLRAAASHDAALVSQALSGEIMRVYDERDDWVWGQLARDRYVGYAPSACLDRTPLAPTHKVITRQTLVFSKNDIKAPTPTNLWLNAEVTVTENLGRLSRLATGGFVVTRHVAGLDHKAGDFVAVAEMFRGTPYLWGGKGAGGIDCSGLVQIALQAAGIEAPRDSDMQQDGLGRTIDSPGLAVLRRGDLVFWKGHVAIMADEARLLHASARHMATVIEPLSQARARIAESTGAICRIARIDR